MKISDRAQRFAAPRPGNYFPSGIPQSSSMHAGGTRAVAAFAVFDEDFGDLRMPHRVAAIVRQKVLFRDIGDVFGFVVLGEQMIKRLVLAGPESCSSWDVNYSLCRNRLQWWATASQNSWATAHLTARSVAPSPGPFRRPDRRGQPPPWPASRLRRPAFFRRSSPRRCRQAWRR